jgi:hypothetical protein
MMAIRLIVSSFSPRFVVLLVVVLKAQAGAVGLRRPVLESISKRGLRGLLLKFGLLFGFHFWIPANEGLPELVIEHIRAYLEQIVESVKILMQFSNLLILALKNIRVTRGKVAPRNLRRWTAEPGSADAATRSCFASLI